MKTAANKPLAILLGLFLFGTVSHNPGILSAEDNTETALENALCAAGDRAFLTVDNLLGTVNAGVYVQPQYYFQAEPVAPGMPVVVTVPGLASREIAGGMLNAATEAPTAQHDPDGYLKDRLLKMPKCAAVTIVPFNWGRSFKDTPDAINIFVLQLERLYDSYKKSGRPIYILAHSWGAVLMHDVMHRIERERPDVKIDKFITLGTPLEPRIMAMQIVADYQKIVNGLELTVTKPGNLRYWKNLWAKRDPFSAGIPAADLNIQIDAGLGSPEASLAQLALTSPELDQQIANDLKQVMNVRAWHKAYYKDFKASLKSLNREIDIKVFDPQVAPELAACMK